MRSPRRELSIFKPQGFATHVRWPGTAHLQEEPLVQRAARGREHAGIEGAEAVQHPRLLVVGQVLDGQVVPQRVARLRQCAHLGTRFRVKVVINPNPSAHLGTELLL